MSFQPHDSKSLESHVIKPDEELLAYYGPKCKSLFITEIRDPQTSQAAQAPEIRIIDADPKLAVVIQPAKYSTQACVPPPSDLQRTNTTKIYII